MEDNTLPDQEKYRIVADFTYDWEYWIGPDGKFNYVSPSCERITGYRAEEFTNDTGLLMKIIHPEDLPAIEQHLDKETLDEKAPGALSFRVIHRNGEIRWIDHCCQPVYDSHGKFHGCRASNREVTDRKKAEEEIKRLNAQLEQTVSERTAQRDNMIHDLQFEISERQRMQNALQESEERFRNVIEQSQDGIILTNEQGVVIEWNQAIQKITGLAAVNTLGRPVWDVQLELEPLHQRSTERLQQFEASTRQLLASGALPWTGRLMEHEYIHLDGSNRFIQGTVFAIRTSRGFILGSVSRDITEQKKAEQRLQIQYAITRILAEAQTSADATAKILQAICSNLDWTVGELWYIDHPSGSLKFVELWHTPGADVQEFETHTRQLTFARGVDLPGRVWASGQPAWISDVVCDSNFLRAPQAARCRLHGAMAFPIGSAKKILGILAFFSHEIREPDKSLLEMFAAIGDHIGQFVERKWAEESLQESEERYRSIFEQAAVGMCHVAKDGTLQRVNQYFCNILGYTADEILGQTFEMLIPPNSCSIDLTQTDHTLNSNVRFYMLEKCLIRKDKSAIWVNLSASIVRSHSGDLQYYIGVIEDITQRKRSEAAIRLNEMRLAALLNLNQRAADLSEKEIISLGLEEAVRLTQSQIGYFHFVNDDQHTIYLSTWSRENAGKCTTEYQDHYPLDKAGIWADCIRLRTPVIHNDYPHLIEKKGLPDGHPPLLRHMSVPVIEQNLVRLVIGVGNKPVDYDESDTNLLLLIAEDIWKLLQRKRDAEQIKASLAEKETLLREIHHRVKNNLQLIIALIAMQSDYVKDQATLQALRELQARTHTMALVHENLYQAEQLAKIDFAAYARELAVGLFSSFATHSNILLEFDVGQATLSIDSAIPCGLIITELIVNALKYAFPDGQPRLERGESACVIRIGFYMRTPQIILTVQDNGIGLPEGLDWKNTNSLGLKLVNVLARQLGGNLEIDRSNGTKFSLSFVERQKKTQSRGTE